MKPETFFKYLQDQVTHRPIIDYKLAANSLLIYVGCNQGDNNEEYIFWLEPTWNFVGTERVFTGSRQAQEDEDEDDPQIGFNAAAAALNALQGCTIESVAIEPITFSLVLYLSKGYMIRTFVSDPTDDLAWYIKENSTRIKLKGSPSGLEIVQKH